MHVYSYCDRQSNEKVINPRSSMEMKKDIILVLGIYANINLNKNHDPALQLPCVIYFYRNKPIFLFYIIVELTFVFHINHTCIKIYCCT